MRQVKKPTTERFHRKILKVKMKCCKDCGRACQKHLHWFQSDKSVLPCMAG